MSASACNALAQPMGYEGHSAGTSWWVLLLLLYVVVRMVFDIKNLLQYMSTLSEPRGKDVGCQSQMTYLRDRAQPRFQPLPEHAHG